MSMAGSFQSIEKCRESGLASRVKNDGRRIQTNELTEDEYLRLGHVSLESRNAAGSSSSLSKLVHARSIQILGLPSALVRLPDTISLPVRVSERHRLPFAPLGQHVRKWRGHMYSSSRSLHLSFSVNVAPTLLGRACCCSHKLETDWHIDCQRKSHDFEFAIVGLSFHKG